MLGFDGNERGELGRIEVLQRVVMSMAQRTYEDGLIRGSIFIKMSVSGEYDAGFAIVPFSLKADIDRTNALPELREILRAEGKDVETLILVEKNIAGDDVIVSVQSYGYGVDQSRPLGTKNEFCISITRGTNGRFKAEKESCVSPKNLGHDLLFDVPEETQNKTKGAWVN